MTSRERVFHSVRRTGPDRTPCLRWDNFAAQRHPGRVGAPVGKRRARAPRYPDRAGSGGLDFLFFERLEKVRGFNDALMDLAADRAAGRGGYALGSGNSIPNYIPLENYHAMIRAAWA